MAAVELTEQNFEETVAREGIAVVDFWAPWCEPCLEFAPVFERVADQNPDILFGKVDTDANPDLMESFDVAAIPMVMVVRDRVVVYSGFGALPEPILENLLLQARELDMPTRHEAGGEPAS
jgi:thioredoxin 1